MYLDLIASLEDGTCGDERAAIETILTRCEEASVSCSSRLFDFYTDTVRLLAEQGYTWDGKDLVAAVG